MLQHTPKPPWFGDGGGGVLIFKRGIYVPPEFENGGLRERPLPPRV